jgi:hypothetical protein
MIVLKLISQKAHSYLYKDDCGQTIELETTDISWTFKVKSPSHRLMNLQHRIVDVFVEQGVRQHEYRGGFSEAISILLIPEPKE